MEKWERPKIIEVHSFILNKAKAKTQLLGVISVT